MLTALTQIAIILAVLKYLGVFLLFQQLLPTRQFEDDEAELEYDEYYTGKSDPTAIEAETLTGYLPGDNDLFDPSNYNFSSGLYQAKAVDDFESKLYDIDTGVEET